MPRVQAPTSHRTASAARSFFARRANALIMAVTFTTFLAIIGSAFVMVTRIERQATRSISEVANTDAVVDRVLDDIGTLLAQDVVRTDKVNPANQGVWFTLLNNKDSTGTVVNSATNEPYDAPIANSNTSREGDKWLAPIEPIETIPGSGNYVWSQTSELYNASYQPRNIQNVVAEFWNPDNNAVPAVVGGRVDADGDGITDALWEAPPSLQIIPDKTVWVAARIIDNCGLLNVNTAWSSMVDAYSPSYFGTPVYTLSSPDDVRGIWPMERDSYMVFGLMPNAGVLSSRTPLRLQNDLNVIHYGGAVGAGGYPTVAGANNTDPNATRAYADYVLRFIDAPNSLSQFLVSQNGPDDAYPPFDLGALAKLFGVQDELALRHRFLLKPAEVPSLESPVVINDVPGLWDYIGEDPSSATNVRQHAPFNPATDANAAGWFAMAHPYLANGKWYENDLRHLLTVYSFDRTIRETPDTPTAADLELDRVVGKFRPVDLNRAIDDIFVLEGKTGEAERYLVRNARYKLALAVEAAGYTPQEALQYVANLEDYLDADSDLTVIDPAVSGTLPDTTASTHFSGVKAYGTERQPFISEVDCEITSPSAGEYTAHLAIELANPYDLPLDLSGWEVWSKGAKLVTLGPPMSSFVVPAAAGGVPGRLIFHGTFTDTITVSDPLVSVETGNIAGLDFSVDYSSNPGNEDLYLVRPVSSSDPTLVVADRVADDEPSGDSYMDLLLGRNDQPLSAPAYFTLQRQTAQWGFTINTYNDANYQGKGDLGKWSGKTHMPSAVEVTNGHVVDIENAVPRGILPPPLSWAMALRPLLVGNDANGSSAKAITDKFRASSGNAEPERKVRLDPSDTSTSVARTLALEAPCDDGLDNNDSDDNAIPNATDWPTAAGFHLAARNPNHATGAIPVDPGADDLLECRVSGRINVNTAPWAVLRTLVPHLVGDDINYPNNLSTDAVREQYADELATFIVNDRANNPYKSIADFYNRVMTYTHPAVGGGTDIPGYFRFRTFVGAWAAINNTGSYNYNNVVDRGPDVGSLGRTDEPALAPNTPDFQERDYVLNRLAQSITTRSDTFTAYVLIRVVDQKTNEYRDRRIMAIFDRSNVFLPPEAADNGLANMGLDTNGDGIYDVWGVWNDTGDGLVQASEVGPDFSDSRPANGIFDLREPYDDLNENGHYDNGEPYVDLNNNKVYDLGDPWGEPWSDNGNFVLDTSPKDFGDWNENGKLDSIDDSGELQRADPTLQRYGVDGQNDPDYFDRQLIKPRIVAIQEVGQPF